MQTIAELRMIIISLYLWLMLNPGSTYVWCSSIFRLLSRMAAWNRTVLRLNADMMTLEPSIVYNHPAHSPQGGYSCIQLVWNDAQSWCSPYFIFGPQFDLYISAMFCHAKEWLDNDNIFVLWKAYACGTGKVIMNDGVTLKILIPRAL